MKCPVCDNVNTSRVCIKCGFDSSRDYEKYPTFGAVGTVPSAAGMRKQWQEQPTPQKPVKQGRNIPFWLIAALCVLTMVLGIAIGAEINKPVPTGPDKSVQMQESVETTESPNPWKTNILRSDVPIDPDGDDIYNSDEIGPTPVLGSDYRRDQISSVTFLDTLAEQPPDAWDVSEAGDGTVMGWVKSNGDLYDLYIGAEGGVCAGGSCIGLFAGYENAAHITFGTAFHTENVQDMYMMFYDCNTLTKLTLGDHFDTSNVQDMGFMFSDCYSLTKLTLGSHFDTSNVKNMECMFQSCKSLKELTLGNYFVTSNVQNMSAMFCDCSSLKSLKLGGHFDTSHVKDMEYMFFGCSSLTDLALGNHFVTSNVKNMYSMFYDCNTLTELTLGSHFDTSNVKDMRWMFSRCTSLTELTLGDHFDTSNADTTDMFTECPAGENYRHLVH